MFFSPV
ncbi:hypothetical protein Zm00014a_042048 [Zea mays]|nr:hypothetical protein Zm00014a_042048 [Zea mays]